MITLILEREAMEGWGYEVYAVDEADNILAHTDVGFYDLYDWASEKFGADNFTINNKTRLELPE